MQPLIEMLLQGVKGSRETRGFDTKSGKTYLLRSKEDLLEYRFLPEPDIPSLVLSSAVIDSILAKYRLKEKLQMMPEFTLERLIQSYGRSTGTDDTGISLTAAKILSNNKNLLLLFESMIDRNENVNKVNDVSIRYVANWLTGPFLGAWRQFCKTKS